ncbi:S-adenosyl-L-methionine dependent methyltransferase [Photobacterium aphoticum]|uniref:S-adenosyl-L-methionine dependent methyltransferase n=1 Tax=Photobacterium aphoticum TaxID=754436 RepID=A0A090QM45_9GAMM|nr:S-adenosyl-L-methionine dependent methyltransferase [Photobacterium aphoticum]
MLKSETNEMTLDVTVADNVAKKVIFGILNQLSGVSITLTENNGETHQFGDQHASLQAHIVVNNLGFYQRVLRGGSIAAAEAYIDGWWDSPDLTQVVRVIARNLPILDKIEAKVSWMSRIRDKWLHRSRRNDKSLCEEKYSCAL